MVFMNFFGGFTQESTLSTAKLTLREYDLSNLVYDAVRA